MSTIPDISGTDPSKCIFDSFRAAIARQVADALPPLTPEQVYAGVDYGKKGEDFTIAVPRFRLPGKPDDLTTKVVQNVSFPALAYVDYSFSDTVTPSSNQMNGLSRFDRRRLSFTSHVERHLYSSES